MGNGSRFKKVDYKMFEEARKIAETSDFPGFKIGCVITYKGHIVGRSANSNKTDPIQKHYNKYRSFRKGKIPAQHKAHAEILALKSIPYNVAQDISFKDVNVYIYRISPGLSAGFGCAKPCPACFHALKEKGVRNIFYTTSNGTYAYERIV